jgi:non-ribosomal peptide synthetase component F
MIRVPLVEKLRALVKRENSTAFLVLLTTLKIVTFKYTGQLDIPVLSISLGRDLREFDNVIGNFGNPVIIRSTLDLGSFKSALRGEYETFTNVMEHSGIPYAHVLETCPQAREMERVCIQMLPRSPKHVISRTPVHVYCGTQNTELIFSFEEIDNNSIEGFVEANTCLFTKNMILDIVGSFVRVLERVIDKPCVSIKELI